MEQPINRVTLRNTSGSPRGFHDAKGTCIIIKPGKEKEASLTTDGLHFVLRCGPFEVVNMAAEAADDPVDTKEVEFAQARAQAEAMGIKVKPNWGLPKLTKEIEAKKAADQPKE